MMVTLNRRQFITVSAGALAAAIVGGTSCGDPGYESLVVSVLRRKLHFLTFDEEIARVFAKDFRPEFEAGQPDLRGRLGTTAFENLVVTRFLLSSDFFRNDADESRTLTYVAYHDPGRRSCANPFAELG
jgi:hypothetical protein